MGKLWVERMSLIQAVLLGSLTQVMHQFAEFHR
jgi:hypothetical protein